MRAVVALGVGIWLTATPPQTFRVSVDAVRIDALILDGNRPVRGLAAADFELRDSGVLQQVESVAVEDVPLSIMFALDASSSVRGRPLADLKEAVSSVVRLLQPGDRAALLTFSEEVSLASPWTSDREQLQAAIERTSASGATALHDATYAALTLKDSEGGRPLVLIFSDGQDSVSWLAGDVVLDTARRGDAVVYGVAIRSASFRGPGYLVDFRSGLQAGLPPDPAAALGKSFLAAITEDTGGKMQDAENTTSLRHMFLRVVAEFRTRYLLTYTPTGVPAAGWHPVDLKVKKARGPIVARRGYMR